MVPVSQMVTGRFPSDITGPGFRCKGVSEPLTVVHSHDFTRPDEA